MKKDVSIKTMIKKNDIMSKINDVEKSGKKPPKKSLQIANRVEERWSGNGGNGDPGGGGPPGPPPQYPTPVADAGGPYVEYYTGEEITFDGSGSTGAITSYSWNFGDGNTGTGVKPKHIYKLQFRLQRI